MESWVFDAISAYLQSPLWTTPVMNFVEEHCTVFEEKEENKLIYTEIHQKFKELIESLLSTHLRELGVSPEEFASACAAAVSNPEASMIVQHILLIDDFLGFKDMMIGKHLEIQERAQLMIAQETDIQRDLRRLLPDHSTPTTPAVNREPSKEMSQQELEDITKAIQASLADMELAKNTVSAEEAEINRAIALSLEEERQRMLREQQLSEEELKLIRQTMKQEETPREPPKKSAAPPVKRTEQAPDPEIEREKRRRETLKARIEQAKRELQQQQQSKILNASEAWTDNATSGDAASSVSTQHTEDGTSQSTATEGAKLKKEKNELILKSKEERERALKEWEQSKQTIKDRLAYFESESKQ